MKKNIKIFENKKVLKIFLGFVFFLIIIAFVLTIVRQKNSQNEVLTSPSDIVLYYGQECSHCKIVEQYIADNGITEKVAFAKKETWHNAQNNAEFQERAIACKLETKDIGVPLLYSGGKCYLGKIQVMDFLKKEAKIE
jgi:hypothetical protein